MPTRLQALLLTSLLLTLPLAQADPPARTAHQLIDKLGITLRQANADARQGRQADAERAVAEQIGALMAHPESRAALVDTDEQGRTPLMLAVSGGYLPVVKALLADADVRAAINRPDANGETAWMVANFAPAMTLMACQPGALTLERYPLLRPYLQRMTGLMEAKPSVVAAIVQVLEAAGAEPTPEAARKAWVARCPNATPELQQVIARSPLLPSLVDGSLARLMAFNKAYREGDVGIAQKPPEGMRFIAMPTPAVLDVKRVNCARMTPPALRGALDWSGSLLFRARIATRAGIVEGVDFTVMSPADPDPRVVDFFRGALIRALAGYQCEGDHVFEQDFNFKVE
ncbi:ankyrin repeat domain-containing protein [Roseateles sp. NT4]|uniref:ankyrin repeat domain-containing protein n=1 Tax=Roseateles sp. NT4 TaxID=3453715 RepID=UPI003EEE48F3